MSTTLLKQSTDGVSAQIAADAPPVALQAIAAAIGAWTESGQPASALAAGAQAIMFELPDATGHLFSLADLLATGPVVLSFNRGNWCPFCNLELRALNDAVSEIRSATASLVVVTPQKPERSQAAAGEHGYQFPMLYDAGAAIAARYGWCSRCPPPCDRFMRRSR